MDEDFAKDMEPEVEEGAKASFKRPSQALRPARLVLSESERVQRRRAGNRAAASRLRVRRQQTVEDLTSRCEFLESQKREYLGQMVQLLSYCKAVLTENQRINMHLHSLGVAAPPLETLNNPLPAALTASLGGLCEAQGSAFHALGSVSMPTGAAMPSRVDAGSLGSHMGAAMPEGLPSGNLSPMAPPLSNAGSPSGPVWDMLLAGLVATNKPPCAGVAPAMEGLQGLPLPGAAAEADALLPPLPPLSAPAAEMMSEAMLASDASRNDSHREVLHSLPRSAGKGLSATRTTPAGHPLF